LSPARPIPIPTVSATAEWLVELLAEFTAFPAALLAAVCERHGREFATLDITDVPALIHPIALQVALFNDVDAGFVVKRRLLLALSQR
jgi:hypothetical protein